MSNILSLSACLVLILLIASPIDCSSLVTDDDRLTWGQAVPAGQTRYTGHRLAFNLQRDTHLLLFQAVGSSQNNFKRQDLAMGHECYCICLSIPCTLAVLCSTYHNHWLSHQVLLNAFGIFWLIASASVNCTHPYILPVLALSMQECLVTCCLDVFRSQLLYAFSSLLCYKASWCLEKARFSSEDLVVNMRKI